MRRTMTKMEKSEPFVAGIFDFNLRYLPNFVRQLILL